MNPGNVIEILEHMDSLLPPPPFPQSPPPYSPFYGKFRGGGRRAASSHYTLSASMIKTFGCPMDVNRMVLPVGT